MEVRWRRVRSMRLKHWLFSFALPMVVFVAFCLLEVGAYSVVQLVPGLTPHEVAIYGLAAQIAAAIAFVAAGAYAIYSPRNDAWIRRLGRRGPWAFSKRPMPKAKFHARYCAARNRGAAALFLGFSLVEVLSAWHGLRKPLPYGPRSIILIVGDLYCAGLVVYMSQALTCFRERLALTLFATAMVVWFVVRVAPATTAPHASAIRELLLFIWASSAVVSLALLKSALQAPPPGASNP